MTEKLSSLEELPEFFTANPFDGDTELQIFEIARLTWRQYHHADKPYRKQEVVQIVGRSVNQGYPNNKRYTIFYAIKSKTTLDGKTVAMHSTGDMVETGELETYETLLSDDKLYRYVENRRALSDKELK